MKLAQQIVLFLLVLYKGSFVLVAGEEATTQEAEIGADGSTDTNQAEEELPPEIDTFILNKLKENSEGILKEDEMVYLAYVLSEIQRDPETPGLLAEIREEGMMDEGDADPKEIVKLLQATYRDGTMLDELFKDPENALAELIRAGMVEPDSEAAEIFKNDPKVMEAETRTTIYMSFVSVAAQGGYLSRLKD